MSKATAKVFDLLGGARCDPLNRAVAEPQDLTKGAIVFRHIAGDRLFENGQATTNPKLGLSGNPLQRVTTVGARQSIIYGLLRETMARCQFLDGNTAAIFCEGDLGIHLLNSLLLPVNWF